MDTVLKDDTGSGEAVSYVIELNVHLKWEIRKPVLDLELIEDGQSDYVS